MHIRLAKGGELMSKQVKPRIPALVTMDRHHICFQKRKWNVGYAKELCRAFVRYVPVTLHRELHAKMKTVPLPPSDMLARAWEKYQENKAEIDSYDVARACAWLYVNIPDVEFRRAMQIQIDYFATKLSHP